MKKKDNIITGGIYLIDQSGNVNPEFGMNHYSILLKTNKKDLYMAFPLTTSKKRITEKYTIPRPGSLDDEYILLYQVKPISKNRVTGKKTIDGEHVIISEDECDIIFNKYIDYLNDMKENTIISIKDTYKNKSVSKEALTLECLPEIIINKNDDINYQSLIIESSGGNVTNTQISTKEVGHKNIEYRITDKYGQKLIKIVNVEIVEKQKKNPKK